MILANNQNGSLSPVQVLGLARISEYLWSNSIPKQQVFTNGTIDERKAIQLYMEWKALAYGNSEGLDNTIGAAVYVYALCGQQIQSANMIYNTGNPGGIVIPGVNANNGVFEFSAPASVGTTITFTQAIGYNIINATRGGIETGAFVYPDTPTGNQVRWEPSTGVLTVASDVPFVNNEFVRILVK
jgi:hypothetical protein